MPDRNAWAAVLYPLRRLARWIHSPNPACRYRWCARPTVGLSVWCRLHADRILAHEDITDWPRQGRQEAP